MKTIKTITVILLISFGSITGNAQEALQPWDYPIKPGTEEWKAFRTRQEMLAACQIPEKVLSAMSTSELLEACLNYPLFGDIFSQDHITNGVPMLITSFNGMSELLSRKDSPNTIIDLYEKEHLDENGPKNYTKYFRMFYLEMLISTSGFLTQLDEKSCIELMRMALSKIQEKRTLDYSISYQSASAIILSRTLSFSGPDYDIIAGNKTLNTFNDTGRILDLSLIEDLEALTIKYLENHE